MDGKLSIFDVFDRVYLQTFWKSTVFLKKHKFYFDVKDDKFMTT